MEKNVVIGCSQQGFHHRLHHKACEDANLIYEDKDFICGALGDGHGARYCFRAAQGSLFAVQSALAVLRSLFSVPQNKEFITRLNETAKRDMVFALLAKQIISHWKKQIVFDMQAHPVSRSELAQNQVFDFDTEQEPSLIYGTTLLAFGKNKEGILLLQQGDGRIIVLYEDGRMDMPVPWDEHCSGNMTSSLCDQDAALAMRFTYLPASFKKVAAVFLISDGIEDSFLDFKELYEYLLELLVLQSEHPNDFMSCLKDSLNQVSNNGSLDDATCVFFTDQTIMQGLWHSIVKKVNCRRIASKMKELRVQLREIQRQMIQSTDPLQKSQLADLYEEKRSEYRSVRLQLAALTEKERKS
jgi:serine/threonine protein phosphatase PrpC